MTIILSSIVAHFSPQINAGLVHASVLLNIEGIFYSYSSVALKKSTSESHKIGKSQSQSRLKI